MAVSQVRQNFHAECESAINAQANLLLKTSYVYTSLAHYFERDDVALPNSSKLFEHLADEHREHAMELLDYQNKRGGRVLFSDIARPDRDEWGSLRDALTFALDTEKTLNRAFIALHDVASNHNDPQMSDFIEEEFLGREVKYIKKLGDFVRELTRAGSGLGEYLFDKETLGEDGLLDTEDEDEQKKA